MVDETSGRIQKLLDGPASPAPPGIKHNFINPSDMKPELQIDLTICLIISTVAVFMVMWTKLRLISKFVIEDCKLSIEDCKLSSSSGPPLST